MTHSHLIGALVGVTCTVLVYQLFILPSVHGRPRPSSAAPAPAPAPVATVPVAPFPPLAPAAHAAEIEAKEQAIAALQREVQKLRADGDEARRRVEATEGRPQTWPAGLPAGYRSEVLEGNLQKFLQKTKLGDLSDIDCDEFPCIAVIAAKDQDAGWSKRLEQSMNDFIPEADLGEHVSSSMWTSRRKVGDKEVQLSAVVLAPVDSFSGDLRQRAAFRAQSALSGLLGDRK